MKNSEMHLIIAELKHGKKHKWVYRETVCKRGVMWSPFTEYKAKELTSEEKGIKALMEARPSSQERELVCFCICMVAIFLLWAAITLEFFWFQ